MKSVAIMQTVPIVTIALLSWLVPVFALAEETGQKQPPKIDEIVVRGNKVLSAKAIIRSSGHKVGDACTPATILEMRQKLAQTGNFGMHHPDQPERWVEITNEENPSGSGKCTLTITVDENEKVKRVQITGCGPIKPAEVEKKIKLGAVYNETDILRSTQDIQDLYIRKGYSISFAQEMGMDSNQTDILYVPIVVTRVAEIAIDVPEQEKQRILQSLKTKEGDYLNRRVWQKDMTRLKSQWKYKSVIVSQEIVGLGKVKLTLHTETSDTTNSVSVSTKEERP